jgi:hypothetical protein
MNRDDAFETKKSENIVESLSNVGSVIACETLTVTKECTSIKWKVVLCSPLKKNKKHKNFPLK